jgi:hypothetical protein
MTLLIAILLAIVALCLAGILYQQIGTLIDRRQVLPPGKVIRAPGGSFHLNCMGKGDVTVILESGISASSLSWAKVQSEVSKFARTCSARPCGSRMNSMSC